MSYGKGEFFTPRWDLRSTNFRVGNPHRTRFGKVCPLPGSNAKVLSWYEAQMRHGDWESTEAAFRCPDFRVTTWAR